MLAFGFPLMMVLMLAAPASAKATVAACDGTGDLFIMWDPRTGEPSNLWPTTTSIGKMGYLDMMSVWLTESKGTYKFGMELTAALPSEGTALPGGIRHVEWAMWIDPSPWNPKENPVAPLFSIALEYDGVRYLAVLVDYSTYEIKQAQSFTVDGSKIELVFTSESIGNCEFGWWLPATTVYMGPDWSAANVCVDMIDWGSIEGQVWSDLPWTP